MKMWLCENGFVLNEGKLEATVIHLSSLHMPISIPCVDICGQYVATSIIVHDLVIVIGTDLSMASHVVNVVVHTTISLELLAYKSR